MRNKIFPKLICLPAFAVFLGGCAFFTHYDQVMTLKAIGDNQAQIQRYLDKQKALFAKLLDDAKNGRLEKGSSQNRVAARYGEPIYIRQEGPERGSSEVYVYRHPTQYFSSDMVYLYFNEKKLAKWEIILADPKKNP
ncbi:MAG: hypothetical protein FJZ09_06415 [Candidatus Omnitrophica bacterium]|nr:hypothetical protein [Candidatus Omnitrophota bacterium]